MGHEDMDPQKQRYLRWMYRLMLLTAVMHITVYALTPGMLQRKAELRKQAEKRHKSDSSEK